MKTIVRKRFSWGDGKGVRVISIDYCDDTGMFFVNYEDSVSNSYKEVDSCYGNFIEARNVFLQACEVAVALGAEIEDITEDNTEV